MADIQEKAFVLLLRKAADFIERNPGNWMLEASRPSALTLYKDLSSQMGGVPTIVLNVDLPSEPSVEDLFVGLSSLVHFDATKTALAQAASNHETALNDIAKMATRVEENR